MKLIYDEIIFIFLIDVTWICSYSQIEVLRYSFLAEYLL